MRRVFKGRYAFVAALFILTAACGDGGSDSPAAGAPGSGVTLSITGSPPSQTMAGSPFSFTPSVTNPNGVALTFSATNLPGWATINTTTGQITGTPGAGDVGSYSGIRVTVSGGGDSVTSPAYSITVVATSTGSATLSWTAPTQKTDGSPLNDLSGYRIYYGQSQNSLSQSITINNPGITTYVIDQLTPATWYFAATAFDSTGVESTYSNTASKTIL